MVSALLRSLRPWLRLACAAAMLLTIAAPAALGPALGTVLDQLGSAHEHVCKCGMKPGTCGCPDCAKAEHERLATRGRDVLPVLKGGCHQDAAAIQFAALPPAVVTAAGALLPAPRGDRIPRFEASPFVLDRDLDPPTPPPRLASV
jgi:hypothetical protein